MVRSHQLVVAFVFLWPSAFRSILVVVIFLFLIVSLAPSTIFCVSVAIVVVVVGSQIQDGSHNWHLLGNGQHHGEQVTEQVEQAKDFQYNPKNRPSHKDEKNAKPQARGGACLLRLPKVSHHFGRS